MLIPITHSQHKSKFITDGQEETLAPRTANPAEGRWHRQPCPQQTVPGGSHGGMLPRSSEQCSPTGSLAALGDASLQGAWKIQPISTAETPHPQLLCDFQDPPAPRCPVSNPPAMLLAQGQEGTFATHSRTPRCSKVQAPTLPRAELHRKSSLARIRYPICIGDLCSRRAGTAPGLALPPARPR